MNHIKNIKKEQEWKTEVKLEIISLQERYLIVLMLVLFSIVMNIGLFFWKR